MGPLAERVLSGDVRATARVCRMVDDRLLGYVDVLRDLFPHTGKAWTIGVTGNPGAGKSSLSDRLITHFRSSGKRVGVVAVDPTSPFSGGAILGDRIRMQDHSGDPEVFIRSLATRGALGGLSRSAWDTVRVLDAWGANVVLVETVGVGQDELEITRMAHSTLVVMAPGLGDDVQAIKAGLLECADVFAINKADREGADATERDLELMIALGGEIVRGGSHSRGHHAGALDLEQQVVRHSEAAWVPRIVRTVATTSRGIDALVEKLEQHRTWLFESELGRARLHSRLRDTLVIALREALIDSALALVSPRFEEVLTKVESREMDPYTAAEYLVETFQNAPLSVVAT